MTAGRLTLTAPSTGGAALNLQSDATMNSAVNLMNGPQRIKIALDATGFYIQDFAGNGDALRIEMATNRVSLGRPVRPDDPANTAATKAYVDQVLSSIKTAAAAATDFADFQARIAAL